MAASVDEFDAQHRLTGAQRRFHSHCGIGVPASGRQVTNPRAGPHAIEGACRSQERRIRRHAGAVGSLPPENADAGDGLFSSHGTFRCIELSIRNRPVARKTRGGAQSRWRVALGRRAVLAERGHQHHRHRRSQRYRSTGRSCSLRRHRIAARAGTRDARRSRPGTKARFRRCAAGGPLEPVRDQTGRTVRHPAQSIRKANTARASTDWSISRRARLTG